MNMCVWLHFPSPSQMPFPPHAEGFKSAMDCGIGKCELLVFLGSQIIYRAQDLQSGRIFFFHSIGQILDALYVYKPPFQQLWKDILNFKWEPCSQDILPTRFQSKHHVERKEVTWNRHLGVATFPQPCRDSGSRQGSSCVPMVHSLNSLYVWKPGLTWYQWVEFCPDSGQLGRFHTEV